MSVHETECLGSAVTGLGWQRQTQDQKAYSLADAVDQREPYRSQLPEPVYY